MTCAAKRKSAKVARCLERTEHAWCLKVPPVVGKLTMRAEADGKLKKHGERFFGKGKIKSESGG